MCVIEVCAPAGDYAAFDRVVDMARVLIQDDDLEQALVLSLKEVLSNTREHAYGLDMTKTIFLSIDVTYKEVIAMVIDAGPAWREDGYLDEPDAEEKLQELMLQEAERGRGRYICQLLTHSMRYEMNGRVKILAWQRTLKKGRERWIK